MLPPSAIQWKSRLEKNTTLSPCPPPSPDLTPCGLWLFPQGKTTLKGKHFEWIQDMKAAMTPQLRHSQKRTSRAIPEGTKNCV